MKQENRFIVQDHVTSCLTNSGVSRDLAIKIFEILLASGHIKSDLEGPLILHDGHRCSSSEPAPMKVHTVTSLMPHLFSMMDRLLGDAEVKRRHARHQYTRTAVLNANVSGPVA